MMFPRSGMVFYTKDGSHLFVLSFEEMMKFTKRFLWVVFFSAFLAGVFYIGPTANAADVVGQTRTFYVDKSFDLYSREQVSATLQYTSTRLNIYTDDEYWNRLGSSQKQSLMQEIVRLATNFDTHIYPVETAFWGSEPNPGIDRDSKLTILFESLNPGNGGYFDSTHLYAANPGRNSNEREMIVLNFDSLSSSLINVFLGHEFQHLISANQKEQTRKVSEEVWLNELRSEYTSSLLQQNTPFVNSSLSRRVQNFLRNPSDSLVEWENVSKDYAIAAVFAEYLTGRFGDRILSSSLQSSFVGMASLNAYLAQSGHPERFSDVFADWMVASYLNDSRVSQKYAYLKSDLTGIRVSPNSQRVIVGGETMIMVPTKYWQPVWVDLSVGDSTAAGIRVTLNAQALESPLASAIIMYADGSYDVQRLVFSNGTRTLYVPVASAGTTVRKVVIAQTYGKEGVSGTLSPIDMTISAMLVDAAALEVGLRIPTPAPTPTAVAQVSQTVNQGALVKRDNGETEAYVIQGIYKRYLRPEIIALYGHLKSVNPIALAGALFDSFRTANYVRSINDQKVYAIWPDGTKHWLRMTAKTFAESGRDWNSIFIISDAELKAYQTGIDITR